MPATEFCWWMNLTRRLSGSTKASSQIPRSPTVPQPRRSTLVDSTTTRPAPPAANLPAFIRCQSVGKPFTAEYWCIGGTTMRLRSSTPRIDIGENSSISDMFAFPLAGPRLFRHRAGGSLGALLLGGAVGLGVGFGLRLRRGGLGGSLRGRVVARDSPGVRALLLRNIAQRPLVGPLGFLFGCLFGCRLILF